MADARTLPEQIEALGPWFHNLHFGAHGQFQTAPRHGFGDFPSNAWGKFCGSVPEDLTGWSVLDIGCNAGFYAFEMKRRGADRVIGIDVEPRFLAQARFARAQFGLDVEFRQVGAYDVDRLEGRPFDLVLFLGVLYHLRHPLYALEKVASVVRRRVIVQTLERGSDEVAPFAEDYPVDEYGVFGDDRFPRLYFVEHRYNHDASNWWIPNRAATEAMLRVAGLRLLERPCHGVYVCEPAAGEPAPGGTA